MNNDYQQDCVVIEGRGALGGVASGYALVCPDGIAGNTGALGDLDGIIYEHGHCNQGESIRNRVLVMPCGKGSIGFSAHMKATQMNNEGPVAWVVGTIDARLGVAIASLNIPAVTDFGEIDLFDLIRNGDWVRVDGNLGKVYIWRLNLSSNNDINNTAREV